MEEKDETGQEESVYAPILNKKFVFSAFVFLLFFLYVKSAENMVDKLHDQHHGRQEQSKNNAWALEKPAQPAR